MFFHALLSVALASVDSTAGAASSSTQTLILQPVRGPPLRIDFNYHFDQALPPFAKEPSLPGKELARGRIPSVPPTPILRNITDNILYANVDHTQDFVTGKFDTYRSTYNGHVFFSDVRVSSVLEAKAGTVEVPVGNYQIADCLLEKEDAALPGPAFIRSAQTVSIRPGQASSLCLGWPLRNGVRVVQDRNMLRLTYQLLGAGREQYEYDNWSMESWG